LQVGSIIVFHDSEKAKLNMEYALPKFINYALDKGFTFKALV
jgi:peptidoglycan-N-acetylglucosamine deacetylase